MSKKQEQITIINDKRTSDEFKQTTFSNFLKKDVKKKLLETILENKVEDTNYWCSEMICSGYLLELWEIIILVSMKYIHYGNPKLPILIHNRFDTFKDILIDKYNGDEMKLRNNPSIRKIFSEIFTLLTISHKKNPVSSIKVDKSHYCMEEIALRLKADNFTYSKQVFQENDPRELFISINEFCYHLSNKSSDSNMAIYWFEWLLQYETQCRKNKSKIKIETRTYGNVNKKYYNHMIWLVWDSLLLYSKKKNNKLIERIIESLLHIFNLHFTHGTPKKRKYIIYFVINLLTDNISLDIPIVSNKQTLLNCVSRIDKIYKLIKKNEIQPDKKEQVNYLFHGIDKKIVENTKI